MGIRHPGRRYRTQAPAQLHTLPGRCTRCPAQEPIPRQPVDCARCDILTWPGLGARDRG
jgi:hypothetical protein